jgi:hypothetical protein
LKVQMKKMFPYNNNKNEGGENVNWNETIMKMMM